MRRSVALAQTLDAGTLTAGPRNVRLRAMFLWITARTIHQGKEEEFRNSWQGFLEAGDIPGLVSVQYAWQDDNPRKVLGISYWDSREACERYRASQIESDRWRRLNSLVESIDFSSYYESEEIPLP